MNKSCNFTTVFWDEMNEWHMIKKLSFFRHSIKVQSMDPDYSTFLHLKDGRRDGARSEQRDGGADVTSIMATLSFSLLTACCLRFQYSASVQCPFLLPWHRIRPLNG
jgi:hypothetical protein